MFRDHYAPEHVQAVEAIVSDPGQYRLVFEQTSRDPNVVTGDTDGHWRMQEFAGLNGKPDLFVHWWTAVGGETGLHTVTVKLAEWETVPYGASKAEAILAILRA